MKLTTFAVISAIICLQVRGDEVDDMHQKYLEVLDGLLSSAEAAVEEAQRTLDEADLYLNHAVDTFTADGVVQVEGKQAQVNSTAIDLTLTAITNNKPASVLTCISTEREKGISSLDALLTPFGNSLNQELATSTSSFGTQRATIALIASQLTSLYETNAANLETCVIEACFESNIATATSQFKNVEDNLSSITSTVKTSRTQFNDNAIKLVGNLRSDSQSALDAAVKAMGKC